MRDFCVVKKQARIFRVPRDEAAAAGWFAKAEAQKFFLAGESYWRKGIQPAFWTFD